MVGSSGGILAGGLTIAGGVMTVMTAGAAAPVLVAGAGLGLASGRRQPFICQFWRIIRHQTGVLVNVKGTEN